MKNITYIKVSIKLMLLAIWLAPVAVFSFFALPSTILEMPSFWSFFIDMLTMLLVIFLVCLPAVATSYALSTGSRKVVFTLLFICAAVWLVPTSVYQNSSHQVALLGNFFWYKNLQLWAQLLPIAVAGMAVLISRIDRELFDLARFSQTPAHTLVYKYFFPLLKPGIWLIIALITSLIPLLYYADQGQPDAQLSHFVLALPLLLLAHQLDKLTRAT